MGLALGTSFVLCALPAGGSPALAAAGGSISGAVSAAAGATPIAGVKVCAFALEGGELPEEERESCTHTEAGGSYAISGLANGEYGVDFDAGSEGLNYIYQAWHEEDTRFDSDPVVISGGEEVSGIDAELSGGGGISGTVTGTPLGGPLAGIEVCAGPETFPGTEVCTHTGAEGNYTIVGLATDSYRVGFQPPEGVEFIEQFYDSEAKGWEADRVEVTVGAVTPNIDAALQEAGQISGKVIDAVTHAPLAGVGVEAFRTLDTGSFEFKSTSTDSSGNYTVPLLVPGQYTVRFSAELQMPGNYAAQWYACNKENIVTVSAGHVTSGIDGALYKVGVEPCPAIVPPEPQIECAPSARSGGCGRHAQSAHHCRKGYHRKRVHGKTHCVKIHKRHRHRRG